MRNGAENSSRSTSTVSFKGDISNQLAKAGIDEFLKFRALTDRVGGWQSELLALAREQFLRRGCLEPRGVQTDSGAADPRIRSPAEAQRQVDGLGDARQRVLRIAYQVLAPGFVADDEHIGLAAMKQSERHGCVRRMRQRP